MEISSMKNCLLALAFAVIAPTAPALEVGDGECQEAAHFIGNAARARDNGMTKAAFVARFDDDLLVLDSFPPAQRWFVHGRAEAEFLRAAIADVFDAPRGPARHSDEFLATCLRAARERAAG
jgi:hypothetical protein